MGKARQLISVLVMKGMNVCDGGRGANYTGNFVLDGNSLFESCWSCKIFQSSHSKSHRPLID